MDLGRVFEMLNRLLPCLVRKQVFAAADREFLQRFHRIVGGHIADRGFTTQEAAAALSMSRMHLNRKIRALMGLSTHQFIRAVRLEAARDLLQGPLNVHDVAAAVGFGSRSQFTRAFREMYGDCPSSYRARRSLGRQPPARRFSSEATDPSARTGPR